MRRIWHSLLRRLGLRGPSMSLKPGTLAKYRRGLRVFVETGTGEGGGIEEALASGFTLVFSIEADRDRWLAALEKFQGDTRVHCILGDSAQLLSSVLTAINEPCVIFLDSHRRGEESPILNELSAILRHPHANTVLIDDLRRYQDGTWRPTPWALSRLLDPLFILSREDNRVKKNDILVAVSRAA